VDALGSGALGPRAGGGELAIACGALEAAGGVLAAGNGTAGGDPDGGVGPGSGADGEVGAG
jgi:hypothetical protein